MKKIIYTLFLIFLFNNLYSQSIDKKLENYKSDIINFLKKNEQILESSENDSIYYNQIYTRKIYMFKKNISIYELGMTSSHSLKFVVILNGTHLELLDTKDFNNDFLKILQPLENHNNKGKEIIKCFLSIKEIYDYNRNAPWKLPWK
jgi:hypothetical protein